MPKCDRKVTDQMPKLKPYMVQMRTGVTTVHDEAIQGAYYSQHAELLTEAELNTCKPHGLLSKGPDSERRVDQKLRRDVQN